MDFFQNFPQSVQKRIFRPVFFQKKLSARGKFGHKQRFLGELGKINMADLKKVVKEFPKKN